MKYKEVVVIGMHRAGTSMISGIIHRLGIVMGESMLGSVWSNPLGLYEDEEFVKINKKILNNVNSNWYNIPDRREISTVDSQIIEYVEDSIRKRKKHGSPWGWKDPRTTITYPIYHEFLSNPYIIKCTRDVTNIAMSLKRKNDIPVRKGEILAGKYFERMENTIPNQLPCKTVKYEEVLSNPEEEINDICDFLNISPDQKDLQKAVSFVKPKSYLRLMNWVKWFTNNIKKVYGSK
jgi:hypothetical protein